VSFKKLFHPFIRCPFSVMLMTVLSLLISAHQTFGQFITILNIPPDPAPRAISSDTQLNLYAGGVIRYNFLAGTPLSTNIEVNISGGTVGSMFGAYSGSTVNISGGSVGNYLYANDGSTVNISGGTVGSDFNAYDGSTVNISGGSVARRLR